MNKQKGGKCLRLRKEIAKYITHDVFNFKAAGFHIKQLAAGKAICQALRMLHWKQQSS